MWFFTNSYCSFDNDKRSFERHQVGKFLVFWLSDKWKKSTRVSENQKTSGNVRLEQRASKSGVYSGDLRLEVKASWQGENCGSWFPVGSWLAARCARGNPNSWLTLKALKQRSTRNIKKHLELRYAKTCKNQMGYFWIFAVTFTVQPDLFCGFVRLARLVRALGFISTDSGQQREVDVVTM